MSSPENQTVSETKSIIPKHWILSFLALCAIGPQYFLNLAFMLNQTIIQNQFALGNYAMLLPSIISNMTFSICVPFGPVLARKFKLRNLYLSLILIFLIGSIVDSVSSQLIFIDIGRFLQGAASGSLFMIVLPISLRAFPNKVRNQFLLFAIGGLFASSGVGAFFGSVSLNLDSWRWLFILSAVLSLASLIVGYFVLPVSTMEHHSEPFDKTGSILLILVGITLVIPLYNLQISGIGSILVWPFLIFALFLFVAFLAVEFLVDHPLVPFRELGFLKPFFGFVMAVVSHIFLICTFIGANGYLRNVEDAATINLMYFYLWFVIGIFVVAVLGHWLYDHLGAGALGIIGSIVMIIISLYWSLMGVDTPLTTLYWESACMGGAVGLTLISGALGAALAGDLHAAPKRSVSLHTFRNLLGANVPPVLAWFLYKQSISNYETYRSQVLQANPSIQTGLLKLVGTLSVSGVPSTEAKGDAMYAILSDAKKNALLNAYHDLYSIMIVLGIILLLASIGKAATGKGRVLVQKEPKAHLNRS